MTALLTWRFLSEYVRRPLNVVLLAVAPVVFVTLSAGAMADFARALGAVTSVGPLEATTAGWAAAFLAGVAGFFHVAGSREADLRLAMAASATGRVVVARLASSLALAAVAALGACSRWRFAPTSPTCHARSRRPRCSPSSTSRSAQRSGRWCARR